MTGSTQIVTVKADFNRCGKKVDLLQLENYKKTFQGFWVQFVEQFVPATTIFVAGERWCNRPDLICTEYEECDFDFEFVEGDVTTIPNFNIFNHGPLSSNQSTNYEPNNGPNNGSNNEFTPLDYGTTAGGPISTPNVTIIPTAKEPGNTIIEPSIIDDPLTKLNNKKIYLNKLQPAEIIIE
jgi:hypothetical protein